jgi:hypothetical protein
MITSRNQDSDTAEIETCLKIGETWTRILIWAMLGGIINTRVTDVVSSSMVLKQIEELHIQMMEIHEYHKKIQVLPVTLSYCGRSTKTFTGERNTNRLDYQIQQQNEEVKNSMVQRNGVILANIQRLVMDINIDSEALDLIKKHPS